MDDIQRLVDALARDLERGVIITDTQSRLLAHSAHQFNADKQRQAAILNRQTQAPVRQWMLDQIQDARDWLRVPANPDIEMDARLVVPIRFEEQPLAWLLIAETEPMTDREIAAAQHTAELAATALFRRRMSEQVDEGLEREGVRDLLDDSPAVRAQAARQLIESELWHSGTDMAVMVCSTRTDGYVFEDVERVQLHAALHHVRMSMGRREMIFLIRPDHAVALVAVTSAGRSSDGAREVAGRVHERMAGVLTDAAKAPIVAVGSVRAALEDARASYDHALGALRVALAFPPLGGVVLWEDLGVYRLLSQLASASADERLLHPGVVTLAAGRHSAQNLELLETYLDHGGDAAKTAEQLHIHRASVYHRLRRIEEQMHLSLNDGLDRLAVHLSVKLIRLTER